MAIRLERSHGTVALMTAALMRTRSVTGARGGGDEVGVDLGMPSAAVLPVW
jgi:hypothetical protein